MITPRHLQPRYVLEQIMNNSTDPWAKGIARTCLMGSPDETTAGGTYACPICLGKSPHTHDTVNGWIGVDLDGTLAEQEHATPYDIGAPIPTMLERVRGWLAKGYKVRIFTSRLAQSPRSPRDIGRVTQAIHAWAQEHIGADLCDRGLSITNIKDHGMLALWDDRAVRPPLTVETEARCPDCGLLLDPPGHEIDCPRRAPKASTEWFCVCGAPLPDKDAACPKGCFVQRAPTDLSQCPAEFDPDSF